MNNIGRSNEQDSNNLKQQTINYNPNTTQTRGEHQHDKTTQKNRNKTPIIRDNRNRGHPTIHTQTLRKILRITKQNSNRQNSPNQRQGRYKTNKKLHPKRTQTQEITQRHNNSTNHNRQNNDTTNKNNLPIHKQTITTPIIFLIQSQLRNFLLKQKTQQQLYNQRRKKIEASPTLGYLHQFSKTAPSIFFRKIPKKHIVPRRTHPSISPQGSENISFFLFSPLEKSEFCTGQTKRNVS
jgi:hypothetical protein